MSKLPFVPTDQPLRSIPVVRFMGVDPNSPEAAELAKAHAPMIRQFYLKMSQNHALGIVDQSGGMRQFGDALSMRYINQNGQETVVVRVAPRSRPTTKTRTEPKPKKRMTHAIVELQIPRTATYLHALAVRRRSGDRLSTVLGHQIGLGVPDETFTRNASAVVPDNTRIAFNFSGTGAELTDPQSPVFATLFVDMLDAPTQPAVLVDLYVQGRLCPVREERLEFYDDGSNGTVSYGPNTLPSSQGAYPSVCRVRIGPVTGLVAGFAPELVQMTWQEFAFHNPQYVGQTMTANVYGFGVEITELFVLNADGSQTMLGVDVRYDPTESNPATGTGTVEFWRADYQEITDADLAGVECQVFSTLYAGDPINNFFVEVFGVRSRLAAETHFSGTDSDLVNAAISTRWCDPAGTPLRLPRIGSAPVQMVNHPETDDVTWEIVDGRTVGTLNDIAYFGTLVFDLEHGVVGLDAA